MIDASGKLVELRFVPHESFFGYCEAARHYFERYGKPGAFYSDKHGIFHLNIPKVTRGHGLTDFGRTMQELGIQIICANTPQAKGRVERANQTLQDRLTKELRLRGISTPEEANRWLPEFMEDYNRRFATAPRSDLDFHTPLACSDNLDLHKRKVKNEKGEEEEQTEYFFGYKSYVSMNAQNGLITSLETTSGEAYDGHHYCSLVDHDLEQKLPVDNYAGDKGYDDSNNHYHLEYRGLYSAILT